MIPLNERSAQPRGGLSSVRLRPKGGAAAPRVVHVCFALAKAPINAVDFVFAG